MKNLDIIGGWFPIFVFIAAVVTLAFSIDRHKNRWRRQLAITVPISIVLVLLTWLVQSLYDIVGYAIPNDFYIWIGLAYLALCLSIYNWEHRGWDLRVVSVFAILFCVVLTGVQIDKAYGYYPTLGSIPMFGGTVAQNESSLPQLQAIIDEVKKTGKLPETGFEVSVNPPPTLSGFLASPTWVYLPPIWFESPRPRLPAIEMFPGIPGTSGDWLNGAHAGQTSDAFAQSHEGKTPILVMPDINGTANVDTECADTASFGKAQTYLTKDVPKYIIKIFTSDLNAPSTVKGKTEPSGWAVAGLSEGGMCAAMFGTKYPSEYPVFADYSGDATPVYGESGPESVTVAQLFGGSQAAFNADDPLLLLQGKFAASSSWFAVGLQDAPNYITAVNRLYTLASQPTAQMASVCVDRFAGQHSFIFWTAAFQNSLPWISWRLGLTPKPKQLASSATCKPAVP